MNRFRTTDVISLFLSAIFISIFAQLTIDFPVNKSTIPITGQSFAVLLIGFFLGKNKGIAAVIIYLIIGIIGFPVFADGASGFEVFKKGSGGFLYGFVFGAGIVGHFAEKGWDKKLLNTLIIMLLGTFTIIAFGLVQLTYLYGWNKALEYGFYPFIEGAIIKIILGAFVGWSMKNYIILDAR